MKKIVVPQTYDDIVALYVWELRTRWDLKQTALAEQLRVSQAHLSRIENGSKALRGEALERFIAFSGQTREQFFTEIDRRMKKAGIDS